MSVDDVAFGMRLKRQAGWNQLEADWLRFLAMQPDGCFVAETDGVPAGTAVACLLGEVAWLAMVLVETEMRGRGIGTALLRQAISFSEQAGARCSRLDATQLGQPLYARFGFLPEYEVTRYSGVLPPAAEIMRQEVTSCVLQPSSTDFVELCELDRSVLGTDRRKFLHRLFHEHPDEVQVAKAAGKITGYGFVRPGSEALQIGPCVATGHAGASLLADAARRHAGEMAFLDIPRVNAPATRFAESLGLSVQRTFVRMCRGDRMSDDLARLWTSSGPELG
jgi:GNAT superfamily N-acetyltransferase